jgi:hypothetical protein
MGIVDLLITIKCRGIFSATTEIINAFFFPYFQVSYYRIRRKQQTDIKVSGRLLGRIRYLSWLRKKVVSKDYININDGK